MWTDETANFDGKYYQLQDAVNSPKPVQKPHPRILVGAEGDRMLKVAAEFADIWNFPSDTHWYTVEEYLRKNKLLKKHCKELGRDSDEIERSLLTVALVGENHRDLERKLEKFKPREVSAERYLNAIVGTAEQCKEKIDRLVGAGVTYFILAFPDQPETTSMELFAEDVMRSFVR